MRAVLIYTLLFPALVYNYAIFSQASPYFFVPGDAPGSKSARHEGVVKSTRPVEQGGWRRHDRKHRGIRRGDCTTLWAYPETLRSWYRRDIPLPLEPDPLFLPPLLALVFFCFSFSTDTPPRRSFLSVLRVGGWWRDSGWLDDRTRGGFERRAGMQRRTLKSSPLVPTNLFFFAAEV